MKVLGTTTFLSGKMLDKIREYGYTGSHRQFRVICKCRGITDANKKCKAVGLCDNVFTPAFTAVTGNKKELELCEKEDIWFSIDGTDMRGNYVSVKELLKCD